MNWRWQARPGNLPVLLPCVSLQELRAGRSPGTRTGLEGIGSVGPVSPLDELQGRGFRLSSGGHLTRPSIRIALGNREYVRQNPCVGWETQNEKEAPDQDRNGGFQDLRA